MHVLKYYNKVPYSTLQLTQLSQGDWHIKLNGQIIHHIKSMFAFYRILDYPDISTNIFDKKHDFKLDEVLLNDYIQASFRCDEAGGDHHCLKFKITEYLIKQCEDFRITYGENSSTSFKICKLEDRPGYKGIKNCKIDLSNKDNN